MNHLTQAQLLSWIDGQVERHEVAQFEAHVSGCPRCTRELNLHRAVTRGINNVPLPVPSAQLTNSIMSRIGLQRISLWQYFLNNAANILGMGIVVSIVGLILSPSKIAPLPPIDYSSFEHALQIVQTGSHWFHQLLDQDLIRTSFLIAISILLLVLLDLNMKKRFVRMQK